MLGSLRARLWLAILLASLVPLGAFLVEGLFLAKQSVERADLTSVVRANRVFAEISVRWGTQTAAARQAIIDAAAGTDRKLYIVPTSETAFVIDPVAAKRAQRGLETKGKVTKDGVEYLYSVIPTPGRAVILLRENHPGQYDWGAWWTVLGLSALLAVVAAVAASFIVSHDIAGPVRRTVAATRELASGARPDPIKVEGPQEIRSLAMSFNSMAQQVTEARAAERQFFMSVTHELKTPVVAVRGYAEAQRDGIVPPHEAEAIIIDEAIRLQRLVQDLLDLSRLSAREFTVHMSTLDLATAAEAAIVRCQPMARSLGVDLELEALTPSPATGDPDRVVQIATNLIENALRCSTENGSVLVTTEPGVLTVTDSGPGLTTEELGHAFERFYLYRRYVGRRTVGTGLGLAIVKELAEAMGGSVAASSGPMGGARFSVRLRRPADRHEPRPRETTAREARLAGRSDR